MTYTPPPFCSICDEPVSLCVCDRDEYVLLGKRIGLAFEQEVAKTLSKVPMDRRVIFFAAMMSATLAHMNVAIGNEAARSVIDGLKMLADGKVGA